MHEDTTLFVLLYRIMVIFVFILTFLGLLMFRPLQLTNSDLFQFMYACFLLSTMFVDNSLMCIGQCDFSTCCRTLEALLISFTLCNHCTFIANQFVIDYAFLIYNLLYDQCINGVLIVKFFCDMCSHAFVCLIFLVDKFSSLLFLLPLGCCENIYKQIHCDLNNLSKSHLNGTLFFVVWTNTFHCNINRIAQSNSNKRLLLLLNLYLK